MRSFIKSRWFVPALAVVLAFLAPLFLKVVQTRMLDEIVYFSLFAISFNLLFGYAGLLSFGHAAFFGLGAYTTAILLSHVSGMPLLLSILAGGVVACLGGFIIGYFCIRRKKGYFVLLTMAFNQLLWAVAWKWRGLTGGDDGIGGFLPASLNLGITSVDLTNTGAMHSLILAFFVVCVFLIWCFLRTPFGNTIRAIKDNGERPAFLGYNVNFAKLVVFGIAAFFAGISGSLFALFQDFVATNVVDGKMSIQVILMTFLGGTQSFFGPILGAAIYVYFYDWISSLTDRWEFFMGMLFIALVLYCHGGAIGLIPKRLRSIFASPRD